MRYDLSIKCPHSFPVLRSLLSATLQLMPMPMAGYCTSVAFQLNSDGLPMHFVYCQSFERLILWSLYGIIEYICSCTSHCTARAPHPALLMTVAHPMDNQRPTEPSDDQSKPLLSSLYQLCNLGQCAMMEQLFMCSNKLILS